MFDGADARPESKLMAVGKMRVFGIVFGTFLLAPGFNKFCVNNIF